jgi:homocysteine S-methyltransferase
MLNLERPDLVSAVHAYYRAAGADVLTTNTFGANRLRLAGHAHRESVHEINLAAARLARAQAAGGLVAGSIGPTGLQPMPPDRESVVDAYHEQAAALHEGGVDVFCCETFGDVSELRAAIEGVRRASSGPIWAQMTYRADGRTPLGLTPAQVVEALDDLSIEAIGVNCAVGEGTALRVASELRRVTDLPLIAQPNAGQPARRNGEWVYPVSLEMFAELVSELAAYCSMVGGCCGTTPAHISSASLRHDL